MKKYKNFPYYFLFVLIVLIISQKFNFVIRGTPIGGHSWNQIFKNSPYTIIWTVIWAFIINQGMYEINKKQKADTVEAKKRIAEREKYYSPLHTHECRVCGCYSLDFPWGEDGRSPSYRICPCCGVQFGKEDISLESIKKYRDEWISKGGIWFDKSKKTEGWDIVKQMKDIPNDFK